MLSRQAAQATQGDFATRLAAAASATAGGGEAGGGVGWGGGGGHAEARLGGGIGGMLTYADVC